MHIEALEAEMSICKVQDYSLVNLESDLCFTAKTDEENSLVCQRKLVPENVTEREDGWKIMRIRGILDFSLIGILAGISTELAKHEIGVFVISTFHTDYILVKAEDLNKALEVLGKRGYQIIS
ncbi:MAG: ACT domain-containing protein [Lachnospiraceae bacterium]|nr:ACT domain-containing protein [Lachnospiraceae bacterium]MDE6184928.1 ACT domain-containing protein [Lachnospiraceae bacterium]